MALIGQTGCPLLFGVTFPQAKKNKSQLPGINTQFLSH